MEAGGDTTVTGVYTLRSTRHVPFVPYEIVADDISPAVPYLEGLSFQVRPVGRRRKGDEVVYMQTDNFPRRKRCALFFFPEIDPQRRRKVEVSYHWPGLFAKLIKEGADDFGFEWRSPVKKAEIKLRFAAELGKIRCTSVSDRGTLSSSRDREGYLVWTFRCRDAPAGEYLLVLERELVS